MKTPQVIYVGGRRYTVQPFEQYVLQFLAAIYVKRNGEAVLNNTLDSLAPLLEVVVEDVCPELSERVGFNRAAQVYFWKGDLNQLAEMIGELTACHFRWQIQEMDAKGLDATAMKAELEETVKHLKLLREDEGLESVVQPVVNIRQIEALEELKAKVAALEAANP